MWTFYSRGARHMCITTGTTSSICDDLGDSCSWFSDVWAFQMSCRSENVQKHLLQGASLSTTGLVKRFLGGLHATSLCIQAQKINILHDDFAWYNIWFAERRVSLGVHWKWGPWATRKPNWMQWHVHLKHIWLYTSGFCFIIAIGFMAIW
jgi:hypothetical protein